MPVAPKEGANMIELLKTIFEVFKDLGEIGIALARVMLFLGKGLRFLMKQPVPVAIGIVVVILLLSYVLKHLAMIVVGAWIFFHMTIPQVKYCGLAICIAGLIFIILDLRRMRVKLPKKEKKKKK